MVELCKRSIELQASNSTVLHAGRTYRLLIGTPTHDTTLTFSYGQVNERYVAFYPDGSPAFKEERGKRGYSRTWYYEDGQVRDHDPLDLVGKHRIARIRTAFSRDGRRDELVILNDTDDYYLDLDKDGHTTLYSFTDLRKGASPYRVVISSACGKRMEVRLYTTRKGRYA